MFYVAASPVEYYHIEPSEFNQLWSNEQSNESVFGMWFLIE